MSDKIMCPNCHKMNDVHKFCVYCGKKLPVDDDMIKQMNDNCEPYCLNCGRAYKKGQIKCKCGYLFRDIKCHECNAKNSYANRFCTSCGKKLWTSYVFDYKYPQRTFEGHFFKVVLPNALRNTSMNKRHNKGVAVNSKSDIITMDDDVYSLKLKNFKIDENLSEIGSRWKIASPNRCINCFGIIKPDDLLCKTCGTRFSDDKKRVEAIQNKKYEKPEFRDVELKWVPKNYPEYLGSLAPAVGESQFEYRERLKWEFAENNYLKIKILNAIEFKKEEAKRVRQVQERRRQEAEYIRRFGGGYCGLSCKYCYEEFFDSGGAITADFDGGGYTEYYCSLGHTVSLGSFCKDYE